jgi:hypothetical protein
MRSVMLLAGLAKKQSARGASSVPNPVAPADEERTARASRLSASRFGTGSISRLFNRLRREQNSSIVSMVTQESDFKAVKLCDAVGLVGGYVRL